MERMISFLAGYLCGNFLTAELLSRKKAGKSAFGVGTGNPGMANMMRQYGFRDGLLVLEPTYKHLILMDAADWGGSVVLDDGLSWPVIPD